MQNEMQTQNPDGQRETVPDTAMPWTPQALRVESAIRSGAVTADEFRGAFKKTTTPFVSIRVDSASGTSTGA